MNLYDVLGLPRCAAPSDIKAAYRRLAKQHHPDAGGAEEAFAEIALAYEVLSDPVRRKRYDQTGDASKPVDPAKIIRDQAMALLSDILSQIMTAEDDPFGSDQIAWIRMGIEQQMAQADKQLVLFNRARTRIEKMRGRFHKEGEADNLFEAHLRGHEASLTRALEQNAQRRKVCETALEMIAGYSFWQDLPPVAQTTTTAWGGSFFRFGT